MIFPQRPIKSNELYEEYGKLILPEIYKNKRRSNGNLIYEDHILDSFNIAQKLKINSKFSDLFNGVVLFHDLSEDIKEFIENKSTKILQVYNPFKKNDTIKLIDRITLNYYFSKKKDSNLFLYSIFKITKNINESPQEYFKGIIKNSASRDVDFKQISKEKLKIVDLLVILAKTCDIYSNNKNPYEESLNKNQEFSFRGKKLRNGLEKIFLDIPNLERRIKEERDLKYNNQNIFNYKNTIDILDETKNNVIKYFENFDIIDTIVKNKGLGSKVNRKNYVEYQIFLEKLYSSKPELFSEEPNLKKHMNI